jgi:MFS family permease
VGVDVLAAPSGLLFGTVGSGGLIERYGMRAPYALAIAVMGAGTLTVASSPALSLAAAFVAVAGAGKGSRVADACSALLVQPGAPDGPRGPALLLPEAG